MTTAAEAKTPEPPKSLVPKGWKVHAASSGDLDQDGATDWVVTLAKGKPAPLALNRVIVAFAKGGSFDVAVDLPKAQGATVDEGALRLIHQTATPFEVSTEFFRWRWKEGSFRLASYSHGITTYGQNAGAESGGSDERVDFATGKIESSHWALTQKKAALTCDLPKSYAPPELATFDPASFPRPPSCAKP